MRTVNTEEIRISLLKNARDHPRDLVRHVADVFGLSRQAVYRHVKKLVDEGLLTSAGRTRGREYALTTLADERFMLEIGGLEEDAVWRTRILPLVADFEENVRRISQYGFTEILNNAIVHSLGDKVALVIKVTAAHVEYSIGDNGIGIFRKLKDELHLEDERHGILELAKGKLTTNPQRHTGEGIFFTTRSFDSVTISSGSLAFIHAGNGDWLIDDRVPLEGTFVDLELDRFTKRSLKEVFDQYTVGSDDYGFTRTRIPLFLAKHGDENLISRSQAKRVVARLDRFKEAVLDFDNVASIGQAFADEIFRVFRNENPDVHLVWVNANEEVEGMIRRALG